MQVKVSKAKLRPSSHKTTLSFNQVPPAVYLFWLDRYTQLRLYFSSFFTKNKLIAISKTAPGSIRLCIVISSPLIFCSADQQCNPQPKLSGWLPTILFSAPQNFRHEAIWVIAAASPSQDQQRELLSLLKEHRIRWQPKTGRQHVIIRWPFLQAHYGPLPIEIEKIP